MFRFSLRVRFSLSSDGKYELIHRDLTIAENTLDPLTALPAIRVSWIFKKKLSEGIHLLIPSSNKKSNDGIWTKSTRKHIYAKNTSTTKSFSGVRQGHGFEFEPPFRGFLAVACIWNAS